MGLLAWVKRHFIIKTQKLVQIFQMRAGKTVKRFSQGNRLRISLNNDSSVFPLRVNRKSITDFFKTSILLNL